MRRPAPPLPLHQTPRRGPWLIDAVLLVLLIITVSSTLAPRAAQAAPLAWSAPTLIDTQPGPSPFLPVQLAGLSCPTTGLCVAVDNGGHVLTSTNPTGGPADWQPALADAGGGAGKGIFCRSSAFCIMVDGGDVVTSTNPTGGASAWTVANIGFEGVGLSGVACATTALCVVGSSFGDLMASTNPTGGPDAWTNVAAGSEFDVLSSIACPSEALCVAADSGPQKFVTATNPASGPWSYTDHVNGAGAVTCPSVSLCVGVGGSQVALSTNPTGGTAAWTSQVIDATHNLTAIACPSSSTCLAVDDAGNVLEFVPSPTGVAWTSTNIDGTTPLAAIACPAAELCVAVDRPGNVLVGTPAREEPQEPPTEDNPHHEIPIEPPHPPVIPPPGPTPITTAQLTESLLRQLTPTGKALKLGTLLKHGGLTLPFTALEAGTVTVGWYQVPTGAKLAKHTKAKPVLVASGKTTFAGAGAGQIKLKLTAQGRQLLKRSRRLRLSAKAVFVPIGGNVIDVTKGVVVRG